MAATTQTTVPQATVDNLDALRPLFLRANSPPSYIEQVFFSNNFDSTSSH